MKLLNLLVGIGMTALGMAAICFPQWFYRKVTPDQVARDKSRCRTWGTVLLVLGLAQVIVHS